MSTQAETVVVSLQDQLTGPATAMGASLSGLEAQIASGGAALREMSAQMRVLQSSATGDVGAIKSLQAAIDAETAALARNQQAYVGMGGAATDAMRIAKDGAQAAAGAKVPFEALAGATTTLGGAAGGAAAKGINLVKFLGQLGPYGALAVVAILGVVAAFAALYAVVSKALTASGEARAEFLSLQGAMHGSAEAAGELQGMISQVAAGSALGRDKIADYAKALAQAKLSGGELQRALEAASIAGSAGGDEIAAAFLRDVKAAKAAGQSVDALAAKMKAQLGGVAARQALALDVQIKKAGESITEIFSGANIEPFLVALQSSLSILSQNTVIGQQFREVITKAMDGFFEAAARVMPYVKEGFVGLAIVAVQLYIAYAKVRNAIMEMIGPTDEAGASATGLSIALEAGQAVAWAIVAAIGAIGVVVGVVVAVVGAFYAALMAVGSAGRYIGEAVGGALKSIANIDMAAIASGIIDGLVNGIVAGAARVVAAMSSLGASAIKAMKASIGMASPAKAFVEVGEDGIGEGVAVGTERAEARVDDALGNLADPRSVKMAAKDARASGGGVVYYIESLTVGSREDLGAFRAMLVGEFGAQALDGSL